LDVTYQCVLTSEDVKKIRSVDTPLTKFIEDATNFYMEFHDSYQGIQGCVINDPLALALTFAPELCTYQELYVDVDISSGISLGKTIGDFYNYGKQPPNMKVAMGVKPREFIDLFVERIVNLVQQM
jgi:purine nucleosidase